MKKYVLEINGQEVSEFEAMIAFGNGKNFTCVEYVMGKNGWEYNGHYTNYIPR